MLHPSFVKKKDTPSRQRRRASRAAAQRLKVAEEESYRETVEDSAKETENSDPAENPIEENVEQTEDFNENEIEQKAEKAENPQSKNSNLNDEFCSDKDYNTVVDELIVKPPNDWKDTEVENFIDYNLKIVGINVFEIEKERSQSGENFRVKIQPTQLKDLKSESFPLRNWTWRPQR